MNGTTILVVDDEPHIRYMLEFKLSGAGYRVITASNGAAAFLAACEQVPALIITDLQMPVCDGLEMSQRLRANEITCNIPVIMLTGRGHKVTPTEMARTNICQLMAKPFSPRELTTTVGEVLSDWDDALRTEDEAA